MTKTMTVRVEIQELIDATNPGYIHCTISTADGEFEFIDKIPVVGGENTDENSTYPHSVTLKCDVVNNLGDSVVLKLPFNIESDNGQNEIRMLKTAK